MTDRPIRRPVAELPSALDAFESVQSRLGTRQPALFLDYDGTLTPIVDRPELAVLSDRARAVVAAVARHRTVCIVSGRDRPDVEALVGIDGLAFAGSHGFDIRTADGRAIEEHAAGDIAPLLDRTQARLRQRLEGVEGALIERKAFSIAAHYRLVAPDRADAVRQAVAAAVTAEPGLKAKTGKMVFEIQPDIDWDKGRAVLWLFEALELSLERTVPLFLGDDVTDEDAFAALQGRGIGIVVAALDEGAQERTSFADYRLDDPDQVIALLRRLTPA